MYAIIRAGGKQAKVKSGDIIEVERIKSDDEKLTFSPLLVVDDEGNAVSDRAALAKASVTAKVLGESAGDKIDIFKYKNKSGYRRRQGHRQKYTRIEITGIDLPGSEKAAPKKTASKPAASKKTASKSAASKSAAPKKAASKKKAEPKKAASKKTGPAASEEE